MAKKANPFIYLAARSVNTGGTWWKTPGGEPIAATNGISVLVVKGATTPESILTIVKNSVAVGSVTVEGVMRVLDTIEKPRAAKTRVHNIKTVTPRMPVDMQSREKWFSEQREKLEKAKKALAHYEKQPRPEKRSGRVGEWRQRGIQLRYDVREYKRLLKTQDSPSCFAVFVGSVPYDRRLISLALRTLESSRGSLQAGGQKTPGFLRTERGSGFIMPFIQSFG